MFRAKSEPAFNGRGEFFHLLYRSLSRSENTPYELFIIWRARRPRAEKPGIFSQTLTSSG
jgi:hypothetical protein